MYTRRALALRHTNAQARRSYMCALLPRTENSAQTKPRRRHLHSSRRVAGLPSQLGFLCMLSRRHRFWLVSHSGIQNCEPGTPSLQAKNGFFALVIYPRPSSNLSHLPALASIVNRALLSPTHFISPHPKLFILLYFMSSYSTTVDRTKISISYNFPIVSSGMLSRRGVQSMRNEMADDGEEQPVHCGACLIIAEGTCCAAAKAAGASRLEKASVTGGIYKRVTHRLSLMPRQSLYSRTKA
ncbi:hypothetical protein GQ54DRAFT_115665 [Martensiomyces pterosporus]|nr:hypothetical protein GQ54DRAFT_115665 [Martensiomyces pterosporus]